ncbi:MAG: Rpn family recombination-promoting nuclease/putative transposase [Magnetococcales bacterium]|nr:Rpn family recombination-promoting nuclease/putative transposase [Magnetococcales bacterium]
MTDHDGIYHQLYAHPEMMADLLRRFVTEPWVQELDLSRLEPVKTRYQVPGLPERESDIVWQVPMRVGGVVYLLVLLEFQSTVERWMPLRVVIYECLLWLQLLHEKRIPASGPLPPIFPMVLYNGDSPWLMPVSLRDQIGLPEGSPLWNFQPDGRFFLIDATHLAPEDLKKDQDSLSALVFRVEQCQNPDDLIDLAKELLTWFTQRPEFSALKPVLAIMLYNVMELMGGDGPVPPTHPVDLLEVTTMMQTRFEAWKETWKEARRQEWWQGGHQEGRWEGRQEGRREEAASMLMRLLRRQFGAVPEEVRERVLAAELDTLETWIDRTLDAPSLSAVFE